MLALVAALGCTDRAADAPSVANSAPLQDVDLTTPALPITPEQVSSTFALGADHTDLQRDLLKKELLGGVIEWQLRVYEIDLTDGVYRVVSQPLPVTGPKALDLVRVMAHVRTRGQDDEELIRRLKTDDVVVIRGRVKDVLLRTVVVVDPAIVVKP